MVKGEVDLLPLGSCLGQRTAGHDLRHLNSEVRRLMPACGLWVAGETGAEGAMLPGWTDLCQGRREAPRRGHDSHVESAGMRGGAWKVLEVTLWESCLQHTACPLGHRGHYSSAAAPQGPFLLGCVALTRC